MTAPPIAAAADTAAVLTDLFVVLLAAKLGDELFKRLGQPTIVGEILAGVIVGPSVLGLVSPGEVLRRSSSAWGSPPSRPTSAWPPSSAPSWRE